MAHPIEAVGRQNWYFTFGSGTALAGKFVVIQSDSYENARAAMNFTYGNKWAFQYTEREFLPQIHKYGLERVPFGTPNEFTVQQHR